MSRPVVTTRAKLLILTAVMASLLEIIDTSIVNVAIPTMMGNLGATLDEISWVVTGYIIANAIVLPIAAWMGQQIGRKIYYTGCIVLFTAASVACGLAPNLAVLALFRVVQGFAGGALLPTSQSLIYEALPREMAGMASAIYGMSVMIGPTIGPTLGGYLTDNLGWRSIFNINLPIGIIVAFLSWFMVEDVGVDPNRAKEARAAARENGTKVKRERTPIDAIGLALLVVGIGSLQFVLERGNAEDWFASKAIIALAVAAAVSIPTLIWWELKKAPHPILELRHFKNRAFRSGVLLMTGMGCMLYGLVFLIPIFMNVVLDFTATQTGELFIPGALASAFMMPIIGNQLRRRDPRILIFIGVAGLSIGVVLISRFDSQTSVGGMFWPLLIRGAAMAYLFVPINTTVLTEFRGAAVGEAAGMLNLSRQLGGSFFIALLSTLLDKYQVRAMANLAQHVTPFDPIARQAYQGFAMSFSAKMPSEAGMGIFASGALKALYFRARKQAFVLAYQHVLRIGVSLFVLVLIPLAMMKKSKPPEPGVVIDAH